MPDNLPPTKVLLAIGTRIYRDATRELLERFENVHVECTASNVTDIIVHLNQLPIDLLIIDLQIPGAAEFILLSQKIRPSLKTIVLVGQIDNSQIQKIYNVPGLIGCMLDDMPITYLVDKITEYFLTPNIMLHNKPQLIRPTERANSLGLRPQTQLTQRQLNILTLIESGHSNKEISRKLNIETCTVKNHVHNILQRLDVNSRCEAASIFRRSMNGSHYSVARVEKTLA